MSQVHRNRSLVLNGGASTASPSESIKLDSDSEISSPAAFSPAWVTKTDRHLQLINSAVYEKQSQQRTKAIEATRKLKLRQRDERERLKLSKHLHRLEDLKGVPATNSSTSVSTHEISVHGIRFRVVNHGSKLVKVSGKSFVTEFSATELPSVSFNRSNLKTSGDENSTTTPKTANIGGVMFYRSKSGNLYRSGIVKAHRYGSIV